MKVLFLINEEDFKGVSATLKDASLAFFICDKNGNEIIGSNTFEENFPIGELEPEIDQVFNSNYLPLRPVSYSDCGWLRKLFICNFLIGLIMH